MPVDLSSATFKAIFVNFKAIISYKTNVWRQCTPKRPVDPSYSEGDGKTGHRNVEKN